MRFGVSPGPDGTLTGVRCPVVNSFTLLPPMSITSTFRPGALIVRLSFFTKKPSASITNDPPMDAHHCTTSGARAPSSSLLVLGGAFAALFSREHDLDGRTQAAGEVGDVRVLVIHRVELRALAPAETGVYVTTFSGETFTVSK
jgi:hypothetical protein